jgi:mRNA interferase HigB
MNVVAKRTLLFYADKYPPASTALKNWNDEISKSSFGSFNEIKSVYGNASIIANRRMVFNIKGNSYRLIVSVNFETQNVYFIWFGTHSEYDKIDAAEIKHLRNPKKS